MRFGGKIGIVGRGKSCGFGAFLLGYLEMALKVGFPVRIFFMQGRSRSPMINLASSQVLYGVPISRFLLLPGLAICGPFTGSPYMVDMGIQGIKKVDSCNK